MTKKEIEAAKTLLVDIFLSDSQKVNATKAFSLEFLKELTKEMGYKIEEGKDCFYIR